MNARLGLLCLTLAGCNAAPADSAPCAGPDGSCAPGPEVPFSPCGPVPLAGTCVDRQTVDRCIVPSGDAAPRISRTTCGEGEACSDGTGGARCRLLGACREADTRCASGFEVCQAGEWTVVACHGTCRTTTSGAVCQTIPTRTVTMSFSFEAKLPKADYSDWDSTPVQFVGGGFLVTSSTAAGLLDSTQTAEDGSFSIEVPAVPQDSDRLTISAVSIDGDQVGVMVADPVLPSAGSYPNGTRGAEARPWAWTVPWVEVAGGSEVVARLANGSAAAWVFADASFSYWKRKAQFGKAPLPLVIWLGQDATWSCGACFWPEPVTVGNVSFEAQIALSGGSNEGYWSAAVTGHELGHWVMQSFGISPNEGGKHMVGVPTFPGQAWSEGWATYHQAALLGRGQFFDKQQGSMFWIDLEAREYSGSDWLRPLAAEGLLQKLDENEVSTMLWQLHRSSAAAPQAILAALASPQLTGTTFSRGYTRHTWDIGADGIQFNVVDTQTSAPQLADFLDALNCAGFPRADIDAATQPALHYPYPSQSPNCQGATP